MQVRALVNGDYGSNPFAVGDIISIDSDYVRKMLVNGLAEAVDEQAIEFMARTDLHEKYVSAAYQAAAAELNQEGV